MKKHSTRRNPQEVAQLNRFETLFRENVLPITKYVARRLPPNVVDEVVAATFIAAWKKFLTAPNPSLPWLYRIASFEVSHEKRRIGRLPVMVELPDLLATDHFQITDVVEVSTAFAELSDTDQEALKLVYWEGLTRAEAATVFGSSENAFNVRLHRAHSKLREGLRRQRETDEFGVKRVNEEGSK